MAKKLYGNNIESACEICALGHRTADGKSVLCSRKGVVERYDSCRRFDYDPLKRIPERPQKKAEHEAEEFEL